MERKEKQQTAINIKRKKVEEGAEAEQRQKEWTKETERKRKKRRSDIQSFHTLGLKIYNLSTPENRKSNENRNTS